MTNTNEEIKIAQYSELLQKIMQEAFQMDVVHLTYPYENFNIIDHGIRNLMWSDFLRTDINFLSMFSDPDKRLFVIKSKLGFYNLLIILGKSERPHLIFVGPFRAEEFSTRFFSNVLKKLSS